MDVIKRWYYCFILICVSSYTLRGQAVQQVLQQKIPLRSGNVRLEELISVLKKQTGLQFSYNAQQLPLHTSINVKSKLVTVQEVLQLMQAAEIQYRIIGHHVILQVAKVKTVIVPERHTTALARPVTLLQKQSPPATRKNLPGIADSPDTANNIALYTPVISPVRACSPKLLSNQTIPSLPIIIPQYAEYPAPVRARKHIPFYFAAGVSTDEIWRISPVIQAGMPWLYAIGGWNTNFKQHAWSIGLGSSVKLAEQWHLHLMLTATKVQQTYVYDSTAIKYPITSKGDLYRGTIAVEKQLSEHYSLRLGPVVNLLKTAYFKYGEPLALGAPGTSGTPGTDPDKVYAPLKVPYTLSNTYVPGNTANTKIWIGLQVSLFYRIHFSTQE